MNVLRFSLGQMSLTEGVMPIFCLFVWIFFGTGQVSNQFSDINLFVKMIMPKTNHFHSLTNFGGLGKQWNAHVTEPVIKTC